MSTGSKIALASAAGVVAATAAGLATTQAGRKMVRQAKRSVTPALNDRISTIMDTVESSLEDHGLLQMIPASVRSTIRQRLSQLTGSRGASGGTSRPQRSGASRSGSSTTSSRTGNGSSGSTQSGSRAGRRPS